MDDDFDGPELDERVWLPYYMPHWSSRAATSARFDIADSLLRLRIDVDQEPWSREFDGTTRVSSVQTGTFSGPLGSATGQLHFRPGLVVREAQAAERRYTPQYGLIEARMRVPRGASMMAALWMIGFEDQPERSGEICIAEIFGRNIGDAVARVGMGIHPFGDPGLVDAFEEVPLALDPTTFHVYAAEWTPDEVAFYVDEALVKVVDQAPAYPMQIMLGLYQFGERAGLASIPDAASRAFEIDWFRGHRPRVG